MKNEPCQLLTGESEADWLQRLSEQVIELTTIYRAIFESEYRWEYKNKNPDDCSNVGIHFSTYYAMQEAEPGFLRKALDRVVTSRIAAEGQEIRFKVMMIAKKVLDARKKPKKKKKKAPKPIAPLSEWALAMIRLREDIAAAEPFRPGDEEPDFIGETFPLLEIMTVQEMRAAAIKDHIETERIKAEFLGHDPTPHTIDFFEETMASDGKPEKLPPLRLRRY